MNTCPTCAIYFESSMIRRPIDTGTLLPSDGSDIILGRFIPKFHKCYHCENESLQFSKQQPILINRINQFNILDPSISLEILKLRLRDEKTHLYLLSVVYDYWANKNLDFYKNRTRFISKLDEETYRIQVLKFILLASREKKPIYKLLVAEAYRNIGEFQSSLQTINQCLVGPNLKYWKARIKMASLNFLSEPFSRDHDYVNDIVLPNRNFRFSVSRPLTWREWVDSVERMPEC